MSRISNFAQPRSDATLRRKAYEYSTLNASQHQIRLLRFRQQGEEIQCEVSVFDIEAAPAYRALSYTWGPPLPTFDVHIDGKRHLIRGNLYRFLQKILRGQKKYGYLWIDQLSIDQNNVHERNHQVALMADIYKRAVAMVMWLGDTMEPECIRTEASRVLVEPNWPLPAIGKLLRDSYFTRLWIVQEFLLSRSVEIVTAGEAQIDFLTISDAAYTSNVQLRELKVRQSTLELFWFRPRQEGVARKYQNGSLVSLLESFHGSTCIDPRDKVYGLLGLCWDDIKFPIDYSKPVQEVFLDATMTCCTSYRNSRATVMQESKTIGPGDYERSAHMLSNKAIYDHLERYGRQFRAWVLWRHRPTSVFVDNKESLPQPRCTKVNHRLHHRVLSILSREMILDESQLKALHAMLWALWSPMRSESFDVNGYPDFPLVTAMGFDEAPDARMSHESLGEHTKPDYARWWYKCQGRTHVFECKE
ncbi:heterokaryon incompatibility protein-domain-containing protein [Phaeosphaeria sp. MPI-PUGE-AT-0046c]|nr:heterokaryon incompatibility protein-domain-containing protein [Phaeosphaeria sp. MPI-PUGE-AT-0046c]